MPYVEIKFDDIIFDPNVQTMCISPTFTCPYYNHSQSCPPAAPYLEEEVSQFNRFFLVYSIFDLEANLKKVKTDHPNRSDYRIKLELQMENMVSGNLEQEFDKFLEDYEEEYEEKLFLYDGTCRICLNEKDKKCTFDEGLPCRYPNRMRYSMEAIGIEVIMTVSRLKLNIEYPSTKNAYRFGLACFK